MPTSAASARRTCLPRPVSEEVYCAAAAVFGALELIAELGPGEATDESVRIALRGADVRLRELGLTREDLLGSAEGEVSVDASRFSDKHADDCPHMSNVIPLRPPTGPSCSEIAGHPGCTPGSFGCHENHPKIW